MKSSTQLFLFLVVVLSAAACHKETAQANQANVSGPAAAVQTHIFHGAGVVTATKPQLPSIEIDHEDIKDLMPAMKMEFWVKDKSLLDGLKPGDHIEFTIQEGVGGIKITEIRKNY